MLHITQAALPAVAMMSAAGDAQGVTGISYWCWHPAVKVPVLLSSSFKLEGLAVAAAVKAL